MIGLLRSLQRTAAPRPLEPSRIAIGDEVLDVVFRRHAQARRLVLRLNSTGTGVLVTVPNGVSRVKALEFTARSRGWIEERIRSRGGLIHLLSGCRRRDLCDGRSGGHRRHLDGHDRSDGPGRQRGGQGGLGADDAVDDGLPAGHEPGGDAGHAADDRLHDIADVERQHGTDQFLPGDDEGPGDGVEGGVET